MWGEVMRSRFNGEATVALNAVVATTTSSAIRLGAEGYQGFVLKVVTADFTSGNYVVSITGCDTSAGTFGGIHIQQNDGTTVQQTIDAISTNGTRYYVFKDMPLEFIKITATRTTDGTLTATVIPFNS